MYVCICNAVTEGDVHDCVLAGACSTKQVKNACDWKPGCGSCTGRFAAAVGSAIATHPAAEPVLARHARQDSANPAA